MAVDGDRYLLRMFPDYAGSVLWVWTYGPVPYDEIGLDADLERDLQAWEASYYAALVEYELLDDDAARRLTDEGFDLARRVADTVGERFGIEVHAFVEGHGRRVLRGRGPGWNPTAEAALTAIVEEVIADEQRIDRLRSAGVKFEWRA